MVILFLESIYNLLKSFFFFPTAWCCAYTRTGDNLSLSHRPPSNCSLDVGRVSAHPLTHQLRGGGFTDRDN